MLLYDINKRNLKSLNQDAMNNKKLELIIQPRVIDHLGIKMYQKPVDVISEFIANAWDADSEIVQVNLKSDSIEIIDKGNGMTFDECQNYFLTVGRDRRIDTDSEVSYEKKRPVLGRKGIGKFAGFGIAETIVIETTSKENGERMDIAEQTDPQRRPLILKSQVPIRRV